MHEFQIKEESLPVRCDICHQSDYYDPEKNYCLRCSDNVNETRHLNTIINHILTIEPIPFHSSRLIGFIIGITGYGLAGLINLLPIIGYGLEYSLILVLLGTAVSTLIASYIGRTIITKLNNINGYIGSLIGLIVGILSWGVIPGIVFRDPIMLLVGLIFGSIWGAIVGAMVGDVANAELQKKLKEKQYQ